jgi:hypothetical protein
LVNPGTSRRRRRPPDRVSRQIAPGAAATMGWPPGVDGLRRRVGGLWVVRGPAWHFWASSGLLRASAAAGSSLAGRGQGVEARGAGNLSCSMARRIAAVTAAWFGVGKINRRYGAKAERSSLASILMVPCLSASLPVARLWKAFPLPRAHLDACRRRPAQGSARLEVRREGSPMTRGFKTWAWHCLDLLGGRRSQDRGLEFGDGRSPLGACGDVLR